MKYVLAGFLFCVVSVSSTLFAKGYTIEIGEDNVEIRENPNLRLNGELVRQLDNEGQTAVAKGIALQCVEESDDKLCEYYAGMYLFMEEDAAPEEEMRGLELIRSASKAKISSADVLLGILHEHGEDLKNGANIPQDINQSMRLWKRAAKNCNVWAQNMLAQKYYFGEAVEKNDHKAYYWVRIAAEFGFPNAEQGKEIIGQSLTSSELESNELAVQAFLKRSQCGQSNEKPAVFEFWGMEER